MEDDIALLRRFSSERAEDAFAEIVRRHVNLVYFAALRQTGGDTTLAEDVTQTVFADLARKAGALLDRPVLTGWLYTSTRFAAAKARRSEWRRKNREQEAYFMQQSDTGNAAEWEQLRPVIDDALHRLDEHDREAVLLRFFEGKSFGEVGTALRLTEEAARKRVDRALDKLHTVLTHRGVTSTSAALGLTLANQAGAVAPAELAASATGAALAGLAAGGVATGVVTGGTAFLAFMSSAKVTIGLGAAAILAVGAAFYQHQAAAESQAELTALRQAGIAARTTNESLTQRLAAAEKQATNATEENARLSAALEAAKKSLATAAAKPETPTQPITHDVVEARYKNAQALARAGKGDAALPEFLWCLDEGMPRVAGYAGVRLSFLLSEIERVGPAGIAALRERRDAAQKRMLAGKNDRDAASDFAAFNRTLKEDDLTIALYDAMSAEDPRRKTLASAAYEQLVTARRYADALVGRDYGNLSSLFELNIRERPLPPNASDPERIRQMQRSYTIKATAQSVEVLAGAGDLANARKLAERLLAYDSSETTKATLQEHLQRAGRPDLLKPAP